MNPFYRGIAAAISRATEKEFQIARIAHLGGGCINESVRLDGADGSAWFVKSNTGDNPAAFEAEFDGLNAIADTRTVRVPRPLCVGVAQGQVWFAMELLQPGGDRSGSQEQLGRQLAALHRIRQAHFGWHRDNTIGATPQHNPRCEDWIGFWREHRLGFQLELARSNGGRFRGGDELSARLDELFDGYEPQPSLVHGDLWPGNVACLTDGTPVVFDPACYFGDREAEFGIIVMFGGFGPDFFRGYHSVWPLADGFERRLPLYELYHTLNHFNLFGGGYAGGCQRLIDRLLQSI